MQGLREEQQRAEARLKREDERRRAALVRRREEAEQKDITTLLGDCGGRAGCERAAAAAERLARMARWRPSARQSIVAADGVRQLVSLVSDPGMSDVARFHGVTALEHLLRRTETKATLVATAGGVESLVATAGGGGGKLTGPVSARVREASERALWAASQDGAAEAQLIRRQWHVAVIERVLAMAQSFSSSSSGGSQGKEAEVGAGIDPLQMVGAVTASGDAPRLSTLLGTAWSLSHTIGAWGTRDTSLWDGGAAKAFAGVVVGVLAGACPDGGPLSEHLALPAVGLMDNLLRDEAWREVLLSDRRSDTGGAGLEKATVAALEAAVAAGTPRVSRLAHSALSSARRDTHDGDDGIRGQSRSTQERETRGRTGDTS